MAEMHAGGMTIMVEVELQARDGAPVARRLVPPFATPAEVVQWGNRFFRFVPGSTGIPLIYREVFAWFISDGPETRVPESRGSANGTQQG